MSADILEQACGSTAAILANVPRADLDRPTPCASWTVRDVVNHVVGGMRYFAGLAETGTGSPGDDSADCTAGDFGAAFGEQAERLVAAYRAPGTMTKMMKLPFAEMPGSVVVWIATGDIFTHGWDLARATGQRAELDPGLAEQLLARLRGMLPDDMRGPDGVAAFGPVVEIPGSAPAADRLAAFLGRHP